jgi:hypothetical protein
VSCSTSNDTATSACINRILTGIITRSPRSGFSRVRALITPTGGLITLSHPTLRADPPSEQQVPSKVSLRRAVDPCSGVDWAVFEPTIRVWRSGTTCKQPANLTVEGAEESLSILSDYTPTVRPPPKRC